MPMQTVNQKLLHFRKRFFTKVYRAVKRCECFAVQVMQQVVAVGENLEQTRCVSFEYAPVSHVTGHQLSPLSAGYLCINTNRVLCRCSVTFISFLIF